MQAFFAKLIQWVGIPLIMELVERLVSLIKKEIKIQRRKREIKKRPQGKPSQSDFDDLA